MCSEKVYLNTEPEPWCDCLLATYETFTSLAAALFMCNYDQVVQTYFAISYQWN